MQMVTVKMVLAMVMGMIVVIAKLLKMEVAIFVGVVLMVVAFMLVVAIMSTIVVVGAMMPMLTKTTLEAGHDGDFVALGCAPESCNIVKS